METDFLLKLVKLPQSYFSSNNKIGIKDLKTWEKRKVRILTLFTLY